MEIIIKPKKKLFVTLAIGHEYKKIWKKNILPSWKIYCKKNNIGLVLLSDNLLSKQNKFWKKATWQRLLIGEFIKKKFRYVEDICILDTDIVINPYSPNIFKYQKKNKINLTSLRFNLPFEYKQTIRKIAFFRKKYIDKNYPLDSLLNCDLKTLYRSDKLQPQKDEFCVGVMMFNIKRFSKLLYEWFFLFKKNLDTTTKGGCQTQLNYLILKNNLHNCINYKFQAIWIFELASRFPYFLKYITNTKILGELTETILMDNYFLHFAGGGKESTFWKNDKFLKSINFKTLGDFQRYTRRKLKGLPKIKIVN
jgi:hypothetical protein